MSDWSLYEDYFINQYTNLTNTSKGGYGGSPLTYDITFDELCKWRLDNVPNSVNTHKKWKLYIKQNSIKKIPINPNKVYKNRGWVSWSSFLNTENHSPKYYRDNNISFDEFKKWIIDMDIKTSDQFKELSRTSEFPKNIPKSPHLFYKDSGWTYWCDIVSGGKYLKGVYWDYEKCKKYIKDNFGSINVSEFRDLTKKRILPPEIPKKPERVFDNFNYSLFLSNKNRRYKKFYLTYTECREIAIKNKINSRNNWVKYVKTSNNDLIPTNPDYVYKSEWTSWYIFLDKSF